MATTTNYGWTTPNDTDLVKDGAAAIRTLGSSIDTTTKALNPSTTLGDIEYRSATANTNTRLPIGTSGQVLSVNGSGVPAWATPAGGAWSQVATGSLTGTSVSITGLTGKQFFVILSGWSHDSSGSEFLSLRLNNNSGANYFTASRSTQSGGQTSMQLTATLSGANNYNHGILIDLANTSSQFKPITVAGDTATITGGVYTSSTAITSIQLSTAQFSTVAFDAGTYFIWANN